jgi:NAD(P)-dependent dehydrogenase (short-subunit alcohol dehydrogenase family)
MQDLKGKVAVVTGASSGIGLGIAKRLALRGCKIVAVGRNPQSLDEAARLTGGIAIAADVTQSGAMKRVADEALAAFGHVDILVNNAGAGPVARIADMRKGDWKWLIDLNLWSVIQGIEAFLPHLQRNPDGGHIVNTSSVSGMFSAPTIGAYAATKYAVVAISETLRAEMEQAGGKVGVSVFLPGPVRSSIHLGSRNRPAKAGVGALRDIQLEEAEGFEGITIPWMEADDAGEILVEGIINNRLYVWTHPDDVAPITHRLRAIEDSITQSAVAIAHLRETDCFK